MNIVLTETIQTGLNNPECAFFVGKMAGEAMIFNLMAALAIFGFLYKAVDKLAFEPAVAWLKKKIYRGKK